MHYLILVALIWSFSFSFIEIYLSNQVDIWFAIFIRILLATIVFTPFFKIKGINLKLIMLLMCVGASQLSFMYFFYYHAFLYISVPEILLFKIMTPIYITLLYDILRWHQIRIVYLFTASLAVFGAAVIRYNEISDKFIIGFFLVQCANLFFALGQVGYKRIMELYSVPQHGAFSWVYLGAVLVSAMVWLLFGDIKRLPTTNSQWLILIWLGVIASGLCYFLWNYGATQVDSGTLAIMSNLIIPIGILVNVLIGHQSIVWPKFILGSFVILLAILVHRYCIVKKLTSNTTVNGQKKSLMVSDK